MTSLRGWQVILANAAKKALRAADAEGLAPSWRPSAEPFWPASIKPPCAIVAPGGAGGAWIEPNEADTLCGVIPVEFSIVLVSGTPSRPAEEILPVMVEAIMIHLPGLVAADEDAVGLWGLPRIGTVGAPQEIPGASVKGAPTFLGAPVETTIKIPYPAP